MGEEKCAPSPETSFCLSQWPILKMSLTKVGCTRLVGGWVGGNYDFKNWLHQPIGLGFSVLSSVGASG